ncbi:MAG: type 1 fimbrial protein [Cupriavidus sp.]|nr:type 1 fimbrial protein [Cupriavidus sp.]
MKNELVKISAVALLTMGMGSTAFAQSQGQVTFNGALTGDTCTISADDVNRNVPMPRIPTSALATATSVAGATMFAITVAGCAATTNSVAAHWETMNMNPDTRNARNLATGDTAATNVDVQLLDRDGTTVIPLGSAGTPVAITGTGATRGAILNYGGQYYATGATRQGTVTATARFTLTYN